MEEALIRRTLPHNIEAEQAVIGAMLMDTDAIVAASEIITAEDFYGNQYGILFRAMYDMYSSGKPVDLVTLQERLGAMDIPQELSSLDFIRGLLEAVPTSANVKYSLFRIRHNGFQIFFSNIAGVSNILINFDQFS